MIITDMEQGGRAAARRGAPGVGPVGVPSHCALIIVSGLCRRAISDAVLPSPVPVRPRPRNLAQILSVRQCLIV